MLTGIHPLLNGSLLSHLDAMGHSDAVVLADAHFPAARLGRRLLDRHAFYDAAAAAFVVVRTGETRTYANALFRKGVVT